MSGIKIMTAQSAPALATAKNVSAATLTPTPAAAATTTTTTVGVAMQNRRKLLLTVENLRERVRQVLKCVINLHIDFLVLESNVSQLLDDCKSINDDYLEVQRLDALIETLRDYNGPTIYHEWPYPLIFKGTIDQADVAQILNTTTTTTTTAATTNNSLGNSKC